MEALISDAVKVWYKLVFDLQECLTEQKDLDTLLKKRKKKAALSPALYLAYLIDPRYQGRCLTADETDSTESHVEENFPQFLPTLMRY